MVPYYIVHECYIGYHACHERCGLPYIAATDNGRCPGGIAGEDPKRISAI